MERWTRFMALTVGVVLVAGPAWAQGTTTTPADKGTAGTKEKGTTSTDTTGTPGKGVTTTPADKAMSGTSMEKDRMNEGKGARAGRMASGANREQVRAAQQALKDKGHDPGPVDGMMGPKTQAALRDFQKKEGIQESGRLDKETLSKLGVEMKTGAAETSSPAASPSAADKPSGSGSSASPGTSTPSATPGTTDKPSGTEKK